MVHRHSLRRLLAQLYQRKADLESLICFFERYGKRAADGASGPPGTPGRHR